MKNDLTNGFLNANIKSQRLKNSQDKVIILIELTGQLDETSSEKIAEEFYKLIDSNEEGTGFIVDFKHVSFMNSRSIGYFIDFYKKIEKKGGKIVIARASENIVDIVNVVGLSNFYKIYPSIEEAGENI